MITSAANALVLNSIVAITLAEIDFISLRNVSGEYFRKTVTDIVEINSTKRVYTFFLSEDDGNGDIVEIGLHGNGATVELESGVCYATQALVVSKNDTQSLTVSWTVEVK